MTVQMSWGEVLAVLVIAGTLILFAPILYSVGQSATAQSERAQCAISIQARLLAEDVTRGIYNPFEVSCTRRSIHFDGEEGKILAHDRFQAVTRTTPYSYDVARFTTRQDQDVRIPQEKRLRANSDNLTKDLTDVLAYEATNCWQLFLEGKADLLNSEHWLANANTCVVCAELTLNLPEDRIGWEATIDLEEELRKTPPHLPLSATRAASVHDYLYTDERPSRSAQCGGYEWNNEELILRGGETYVVGFYRTGAVIDWLQGRFDGDICQAVTITTAQEFAMQCTGVLN